jgi:uncharacterized flavoprotein (TIGR03862 family)
VQLAIIGGGPAGLRAAEVAATHGAAVTLFEAKASVGRKYLVAGRGGLNLTNAEPRDRFATRYSGPPDRWPELLADFDAEALRAWAAGLGVETFAASTGRVYPREMKAAPLLRRWVQRLRELGVQFATHHRWLDLRRETRWLIDFQIQDGTRTVEADAVILALGGGSWPETGSDGAWTAILQRLGIAVAALQPANCGWEYPWPAEVLAAAEGQPLKSIVARTGTEEVRGELLITRYGLEGGALYQLGPALRAQAEPKLTIDLKPSHTVAQLVAKLGPIRSNFLAEARSRWRLSDAAYAILAHCGGHTPPDSAAALAATAKSCVLSLIRPRPLAEAISSAGGVCWSEVDDGLMLRKLPGIFLAGEMIDWEAPTGGYLIQGCFATGTRAAKAALAWPNRAYSALRR